MNRWLLNSPENDWFNDLIEYHNGRHKYALTRDKVFWMKRLR